MEVTPKKLSSAKSTTPLPMGTLEPISGSATIASSQTVRQTSGVGGFHLSKLEGRATARLNVEASWFDTTMSNSFNPARATKAEIEAYEGAKATINSTLGSPVVRRRIDGLVRDNLKVRKPFTDSQMAHEALSGNRSLIVHPASQDTISNNTQDLNPQSVNRIGSQIGPNPLSASSNLGGRFNFASGSVGSISTSQPAAERRLYPILPHFNGLQSKIPNIQDHSNCRPDSQPPPGSQGSSQGSFVVMDVNNAAEGHCLSNFAGDIKRESFVSGTGDGPIQRPSSTLSIDPHRGPPEFQPGRMEHLNQFNSIPAAYPGEIMSGANQIFGTTGVFNASANPGSKMGQANHVYDSTPGNNHLAEQNGKIRQFNQAYLANEAYNSSTVHGGPLSHTPAAYNPNFQYAASGYEGGSITSNTQCNPFPASYAAPGNPIEPATQFKSPYRPNALYGPSGKQNALLEEVNRALGASRPFASSVDQNATTARIDQFSRQPSAPAVLSYASIANPSASLNLSELIPPNHPDYGAPGYHIPKSQGGVMGQSPGFSGQPKSYASSENQTVGMQNRDQHTNLIGRYAAHGDQASETAGNIHQYGLSPPSFASLETQPRAISSANQGYELPPTYSLYGLQGGGMTQANQLNDPSPSAIYVADGSQAGSFESGSVTVGHLESLKNSPERNTKPKELHMPQGQSHNQPLVLKNYFGPNPFGPIAPPSGPIKLPPEQPKKPSFHLHYIAPNGTRPQVDMALDAMNLPFVELCRNTQSYNKGVLRIVNIPWNVNRAEILAFLGRNAQVKEAEEPVHIILDRFSGKTMEAYVEFEDLDEVMNAVNRYYHNKERGRSGRLGDRHVVLEVSCQEALMKALFPKAKNVTWNGPRAVIQAKDPHDMFNSGFQGFLTNEELLLLIKCVEQPQRTPYGIKCPQRPFESMISILKKYPWYMVDHITLADRDLLFGTARQLTDELYKKILEDPQNIDLNHRLLRRLQLAIFKCHGFTEAQKDDICYICDLNPTKEGLAPYADHWYVLKAIGPRPFALHDVILFYMALLREATTLPGKVSLAERASNEVQIPLVFGNMGIEYPANVQQMTFAQVARIEWTVIERLLRKILED